MAKEKILIIDDEVELSEIVRDYLTMEGFTVMLAFDGQEGLKVFNSFQPHLIILDNMLPKISGMELCRQIRALSPVPILMLSAKAGDMDKIVCLGMGADDYMVKPFNPAELVARVKALLRRYMQLSPSEGSRKAEVLEFGELTIDHKSYTAYVGGKNANLAAKEFEILYFMASHPHQVFTREQIFNQIWGFDEYGDINTVTVHIRKIREKLEKDPSKPVYIKTVWSVGYKFDGDEE